MDKNCCTHFLFLTQNLERDSLIQKRNPSSCSNKEQAKRTHMTPTVRVWEINTSVTVEAECLDGFDEIRDCSFAFHFHDISGLPL